jgi:hypothetical protein
MELNFSYVHPGEFSGVLRLEVVGGVEKAYLNGELWATGNDTALSAAGSVGVLSVKGPVSFQNFSASFIQAASSPNFSDSFDRPDGTWLGSPWSVDIGGLGLSSQSATPLDAVSLASLYGYSQSDVVVSANVDVSGVSPGGQQYSSLFARRDAAGDMYVAMLGINLTADPRAAVLIWLYRPGNPLNNGWTLLNFSYVTGGAEAGLLTFTVSGNSLTASFEGIGGPTTVQAMDSNLAGPGDVGMLNIGLPTHFTNFSVT